MSRHVCYRIALPHLQLTNASSRGGEPPPPRSPECSVRGVRPPPRIAGQPSIGTFTTRINGESPHRALPFGGGASVVDEIYCFQECLRCRLWAKGVSGSSWHSATHSSAHIWLVPTTTRLSFFGRTHRTLRDRQPIQLLVPIPRAGPQ